MSIGDPLRRTEGISRTAADPGIELRGWHHHGSEVEDNDEGQRGAKKVIYADIVTIPT